MLRSRWFAATASAAALRAMTACSGDAVGGTSCVGGVCAKDAAVENEAAAQDAGLEPAALPDAERETEAAPPEAAAPDAAAPDAVAPDAGGQDATVPDEGGADAMAPDADAAQVAYVDPGGTDNADCTQASPCTRVAAALATNRPFVRLHGTTDEAVTVQQSVTLLADPGAKLTNSDGGTQGAAVLTVEPSGPPIDVHIEDLEITGAPGPYDGWGIYLPSGGGATLTLTRVKVTNNANVGIMGNGGTVTLSQCTVTGNGRGGAAVFGYGDGSGVYVLETALTVTGSTVADNGAYGVFLFGHGFTLSQVTIGGNVIRENPSGGLEVLNATSVDIVNNVFFANGSGASAVGGVLVEAITPASPPAPSRIAFNSFSRNLAMDGVGSAIQCGSAVTLAARNDVMSGNGTATNAEPVGGACAHTYSIVQPGTLPAGTGNLAVDPQFVDAGAGDLHLQPTSPARGAADPNSDLSGLAADDIDGDRRASPADIGADQTPARAGEP